MILVNIRKKERKNRTVRALELSAALLAATTVFAAGVTWADPVESGFFKATGDTEATANTTKSVAAGNAANAEGTYSVAVGDSASASGVASIAIGSDTVATNNSAIAIGNNAEATSQEGHTSSLAIGAAAKATADSTLAIGHAAKASVSSSYAIGFDANASASHAMALGTRSISSGTGSVAIGVQTEATAEGAISIGSGSKATEHNTIAIGHSARTTDAETIQIGSSSLRGGVEGFGSIAVGNTTTAKGQWYATAMGYQSLSLNDSASSYGASSSAAKNSVAIGAYSHAGTEDEDLGGFTLAKEIDGATNATAVGYNTNASGKYASAIGSSAKATNEYATATGVSSQATGWGSAALSGYAKATDTYATAAGMSSTASGNGASALGAKSEATANYASAAGNLAKASGEQSTAVGYSSKASGTYSTAIGAFTNYSGNDSEGTTAIGYNSSVTVANGVALGRNSVADVASGDTGYDPATGAASTNTGKTWKSTMGAVSVGNSTNTRQIINVAAGSRDTDAVNVAQLKQVATAVNNSKTHYYSVNSTVTGAGSNYNNDGATGLDAIAAGPNASATGDSSIAIGYGAQATGNGAIAIGEGSTGQLIAAGEHSYVHGFSAQALGPDATAWGILTVAGQNEDDREATWQMLSEMDHAGEPGEKTEYGIGATAWGQYNKAYGTDSTAFGEGNIAYGIHSTAFGTENVTYGRASTAWGENNEASGYDSTAFGQGTVASNYQATAFGSGTTASGQASTAFGISTTASGFMGATAFGMMTTASGSLSTAFGSGTTASGAYSTAFGANTYATNNYATAWGASNTASGQAATAFGNATQAKGNMATAFGARTTASSNYATAFGLNNTASNQAATAFGNLSIASGVFATAFGQNTEASGKGATAFGIGTADEKVTASGEGATAFGSKTVAAGNYSTAFGVGSKAYGNNSLAALGGVTGTADAGAQGAVAIGEGALAQNSYTYAIGQNASVTVDNGVAFGNSASVTAEGGVALGSSSTANVASGVAGYDPATGKASTDTTRTWKSTMGAVSVGDGSNTRQIINVAAGTEDTDAVNVAQLKQVASAAAGAAENARTHYYSVNDKVPFLGVVHKTNYNNDGATGTDSLAAGVAVGTNGQFSSVAGAYSSVAGSTTYQGTGASVFGSFNEIGAQDGAAYDGVGNSVVGLANSTSNANGALIFGTGNTITNSYGALDDAQIRELSGAYAMYAAAVKRSGADSAAAKTAFAALKAKMDEFGESAPQQGGDVLAIGGGNTADYAKKSSMIGVGNSITGTANAAAEFNSTIGYNNTIKNGSNNSIIGTNRTVSGASGVVVMGAASKAMTTNVDNAVVIGTDANVTTAGGVAVGWGSISDRAAGVQGANPLDVEISQADAASAKWKSTAGAFSIGGTLADGTVITRQITGVAAGTEDTDAVNVAQLKRIALTAGEGVTIGEDNKINLDAVTRYAGDFGEQVSVSLDNVLTVKGSAASEKDLTTGNIGVVTDPESQALIVKLNKDVDLGDSGSVTVGNTKVNADGVTITGGPSGDISISSTAVSMGGNRITNVAPGVDPTDAVNMSQLMGFTGGWYLAVADGDADKVAGDTVRVVVEKNEPVGDLTTDVLSVKKTVNDDGEQVVSFVVADAPTFGGMVTAGGLTVKAKSGDVVINNDGISAGGNKITNVAKGDVNSSSTDAVNGSQLYDLGDSVVQSFGGTSVYNSSTGKVEFNVKLDEMGSYNDISSALQALDTKSVYKHDVTMEKNLTVGGTFTANGPAVFNEQVTMK